MYITRKIYNWTNGFNLTGLYSCAIQSRYAEFVFVEDRFCQDIIQRKSCLYCVLENMLFTEMNLQTEKKNENLKFNMLALVLQMQGAVLTLAFGKMDQCKPILYMKGQISLMSSLRVISLTVLADSIYNILIFFAEKM